MTHYALYWPRYLDESGATGEPVQCWRFRREAIVDRLQRGDRFWLFVGGDAAGDSEEPGHAYLAQLLVVESWGNDPEFDPNDPSSPQFRVMGDPRRCVLVQPPLDVDRLLRKSPEDSRHIGKLRQSPGELDWQVVGELLQLLKKERPEVYSVAMQKAKE